MRLFKYGKAKTFQAKSTKSEHSLKPLAGLISIRNFKCKSRVKRKTLAPNRTNNRLKELKKLWDNKRHLLKQTGRQKKGISETLSKRTST